MVILDDEADDGLVDDADGAGDEPLALVGVEGDALCEVHDVVGPLADEMGVGKCLLRAAEHTQWLVSDLVAVAVRAMEQVVAPAFTDSGDVGRSSCRPVVTRTRRLPSDSPLSRPNSNRRPRLPSTAQGLIR